MNATNCVLAFTGAGQWIWWVAAAAVALGIAGAILLIIARRTRSAVWTILAVAAFALVALGSQPSPAYAASDCAATTPPPATTTPAIPPVISVDDVSVNEDSGVANVVITRMGATTGDIVLNLATQDGTAQVGDNDYDALNTNVTIPASTNPLDTITVPITVNPDAVYEPDEQFGVTLTSVSGAIDPASNLSATVTILNDDSPPVITVHDVSVNEDTGVANVVITRSGATAQNISFNLTTQIGSAIPSPTGGVPGGSDYDSVNNTYTFTASTNGTETITVPITINPDTVYETDEQFGVTLDSIVGTIGLASDLDATVTIVNDDAPPTISIHDVSVNEDTGIASMTITRSGATAQGISFQLMTQDGSAITGNGIGGHDYESVNNTYTFAASNNPTETITVQIPIDPDTVYEPNEQFTINLTPAGGTGTINSNSDLNATVTIVNDDAPPTINIQNVTVNEDTGQANMVITRSGATAQDLTFQLVTQDGSAISGNGIGGNDYVSVNNTYTFAASNNPTETITVPITINPDTTYEPDEQFSVNLTPVAGTGTISGSSDLNATVTIRNDDTPPTISIADVSVNEDSGVATLTIRRVGPTAQDVSFTLSTQDGTATAGGSGPGSHDYDPITNAHYTIPASNNPSETLTVNITINPDTDVENDETFNVNLTSVTGTIGVISRLNAVITIVNDEAGV